MLAEYTENNLSTNVGVNARFSRITGGHPREFLVDWKGLGMADPEDVAAF